MKPSESPTGLVRLLVASGPTNPRLTWYDDQPGPTQGERIELSGAVLVNWANKAAGLLTEEFDVTPGERIAVALPPHWRTVYWSLATWLVGGIVVLDGDPATCDVLVTDQPGLAASHDQAVLVHLPALSRHHPEAAQAPLALDEARVLATYADTFAATDPDSESVGLVAADGEVSLFDLSQPRPEWGAAPRVWVAGSTPVVLRDALAAFAADGSVLLSRGEAADAAHRAHVEGVTVRA